MNTKKTPNPEMFQDAVDKLMHAFETQNFPKAVAYTIIRRNEAEVPVPFDSYSLLNKLIAIYVGHTNDCRGYKQWSDVGRHIKKGAKSFRIIAPLSKKIEETDAVTGNKKEKTIICGFKAVPVFADHDTEPDDPKNDSIYKFDYTPCQDKLPYFINVAKALGIAVKWRPIDSRSALGWYSPASNSITMTSSDNINFFHELAHAIHDSFEPLIDVPNDKAEAVAETTAAVICAMLGVEGYHQKDSFQYIQNYCEDKTPQGVLKKISSVLTIVEKIVTIILVKARELENNTEINSVTDKGGK